LVAVGQEVGEGQVQILHSLDVVERVVVYGHYLIARHEEPPQATDVLKRLLAHVLDAAVADVQLHKSGQFWETSPGYGLG